MKKMKNTAIMAVKEIATSFMISIALLAMLIMQDNSAVQAAEVPCDFFGSQGHSISYNYSLRKVENGYNYLMCEGCNEYVLISEHTCSCFTETVVPATCMDDGYTLLTCTECGETKEGEVQKGTSPKRHLDCTNQYSEDYTSLHWTCNICGAEGSQSVYDDGISLPKYHTDQGESETLPDKIETPTEEFQSDETDDAPTTSQEQPTVAKEGVAKETQIATPTSVQNPETGTNANVPALGIKIATVFAVISLTAIAIFITILKRKKA